MLSCMPACNSTMSLPSKQCLSMLVTHTNAIAFTTATKERHESPAGG